ncbi:hypothetical protein E0L36_26600 [Streptomyces sp. AJS327]|uniref:P22 phage major capsid protein family protein n=1 Tax=Streptomyces sp. AJS327 TaxID=2545265 RepID=UPI0015DE3FF8|nr:P22 phage major capsid protein family protein [Streptomyces sp. AJS327]MBA0054291.1 hypothetical protein [Streptomyces sp. AJS327]
MAHAFLKPEVVTSTALGILEQELVMANLVWANPGFDFAGAKDDTVTVRLPGKTTANEYEWRNDRSADIVLSDIVEDSVSVTLNKDIYSAVALTDEELSLDISDFGAQVLRPQVKAVATAIDTGVKNLITGASYATTVTVNEDQFFRGVVAMRTALNKENVPQEGRVLLVGAEVEAAFLNSQMIRDVSQSGSDSALRSATLGRVAGFDVVVSNLLGPTEMYAFVPSAFILATRAPAVPSGATFASSQSFEGLSMRWIRDYDPMKLRDRSVVSIFAGFNVMRDTPAAGGSKKLVRAVKGTFVPTPDETPEG